MKRTWAGAAQSARLLMGLVGAAAVLFISTIEVGKAANHHKAADVDGVRIANAERDPASWVSYGRTYSEQRYSPLSQITPDNAGKLGLAWYGDLDTNRGQEATPLVIDGVM